MAMPKHAVLTAQFLPNKKSIVDFFENVVIPSGYIYFEWDNIVYKVTTDTNSAPKFGPSGNFYNSLV